MSDLIDDIHKKNIEWYGKCVLQPGGPEWGEIFTKKLYSDRTHFVYELLQNAEDACERKRKLSGEAEFRIHFKLTREGLEIRHNGIIFNDSDIKGICHIGRGTKKEDVSQIGKFGIGFKSIYAYTKSPYIYSGDNAFRIENLVLPYREKIRKDCTDGETVFVLPFNREEVASDKSYEEIEKRLKNLGLKTLLFLRNIREITWKINGYSGKYSRFIKSKEEFRWITLLGDNKACEKWLVFEKPIPRDDKGRVIEIAYLVDEIKDKGKEISKIVNAKDTKLMVYFPTEKETHLNFLIQGPYNTTATRENIEIDDWNRMLISETGNLIAETIPKVKSLGLLNVSFLTTLPLDATHFSEETNFFKPIYDKVKEKLSSNDALLPTDNDGFVSAKNALLASGTKNLLNREQLSVLFKRTHWLNSEITHDKTLQLREYLIHELGIPEIDSERFARTIDDKFMKEQTDDWMIEFYKFIHDKDALWRKETSRSPEGVVRSKAIIRLDDGTHVKPFDSKGKPQANLPSTDDAIKRQIRGFFPSIKETIAKNSEACKFLKDLGFVEPDAIEAVRRHILPKYRPWNNKWEAKEEEQETALISLKENIEDVQRIIKALNKSASDSRREELLLDIRKTELLYAKNMADGMRYYCSSNDGIYIGNKDVETFFEGNDDIWLLDEMYKKVSNLNLETLRMLGCKVEIEIRFRKPQWRSYLDICNDHGNHKRGLDGFDPDCEIDGLEQTLKNITLEKSIIIWNLLKKYYNQISGTVEVSTRQDFSFPNKTKEYSKMGKILVGHAWLYSDKDLSRPSKPSEITLTDISEKYDKGCPEARILAGYLNFKTPVKEELKEKMSTEEREMYNAVEEAVQLGYKEKVLEFIEKLKTGEIKKGSETPSEVASELKDILTSTIDKGNISDETTEVSLDPTPEEEKEIQKIHGTEIPKILKKLKLQREVKTMVESKTIGAIDTDQFLLAEYNGHCQICNLRLFLGSNDRGKNGVEFVTTHLIETRNKRAYAEMEWNVLCLCPNHFALFKWGIKELKGIWDIAKSVLNDDIAADWVEERRGSYYIARIKMMGENGKLQETELFYSPTHMRKIVALLKEKDNENLGTTGGAQP